MDGFAILHVLGSAKLKVYFYCNSTVLKKKRKKNTFTDFDSFCFSLFMLAYFLTIFMNLGSYFH